MATIRTAIALYDGVTSPLRSMQKAMAVVLNSFEAMQQASGNSVDVSAIQEAREELAKAETAFDAIEQNIQDADNAQQRLNQDLNNGTTGAGNLLNKVKQLVAAYAGIQGVKTALNWAKENLSLANAQRNAETQLKTVLANVGATEDAFDRLAAKATAIQSGGMYGDEAMLGGAAELATYISDVSALESMMGTLANYAAGMSGGGAVDQQAMVDYATQLGKALDGTYDGLKKKGFELSDAQKEIIENGTDMEKALVLDEVISQSWANLYDTMSDTPEGKIISLQNKWGDLREVVGNKLYPAVIRVVDAINSRWPKIENVVGGVTQAVGTLIGILGVMLDFGINVADVFVSNWSWIAPIILGVAGAYLVLHGAMLAYNTIQTIGNSLAAISAARSAIKSGLTLAEAAATTTATGAQVGLNAALLACPITWIIIGIIALVALFYAAVAAVNKFAGTSVSATGIICGAFMAALAFVGNIFVVAGNLIIDVFVLIYNLIATVANFVGNVFVDPVGAVCRLFFDLADTVLSVLQSLASAIDTIFGSNLSGAVQGWRDSLGGWVDETFGKGTEVMAKLNADDLHLDRFEYGAAFDLGYNFGEGIEDKVSGLFDFSIGDPLDAFDLGNTLDGIYGNTGDTANNTAATADALDIAEEDLAYLRDIAEREAINRFTTAEIRVEQQNTNYISQDTDLDGIMDAWANDFAEKLDVSEEGVHE